ncbi:MAG TPA: pitrilysin family protein [Melioribacteraceae bacterium]|nr:pitrilysin family protein [Melioribacteraceae bacterium]
MIKRETAPLPSALVPFEIPEIKLIKATGGLEVYYVQKEKLPIIQAIFISSAGSIYDPEGKNGLAFLTSLLIDEGAAEYDALQLNNELEKLGTITGISISHDAFTFSILSLKEHFERSFELISKIILEPRFEENDFNREKKKTLDKILQLKDEPSYIANSAFEKRIFAGTNYSNPEIGFEESVKSIANGEIKDFYRNEFLRSDLKIILTGNITGDEILNLINRYLSAWNFDNQLRRQKLFSPAVLPGLYIVDKKESAQSEIRVGNLIKNRNSEDYHAARLMNTILGGQFSSRINLNLREKRGYTYGAGSALNYNKESGYFEISTAVNIDNSADAVVEILNEMKLIRENITQAEIEFARSYLIKQFPSRFETYTQIARNISPLILHNLPIDYYHHYQSMIENVKEEEILKAAKEYVLPEKSVILITGDKEKIVRQLGSKLDMEPSELDIYGNPV